MTDDAQPARKTFWFRFAATCAVAGLLWWADGRLWPSTAAYADDSLLLVLGLKLLLGSWLSKSPLGRAFAVIVDGAFLWWVAEWVGVEFADSDRRPIILVGAGAVAAMILLSGLWERLPTAWRERIGTSKIARGFGAVIIAALVGGVVWQLLGASVEGIQPRARWGVLGVILAMSAGLVLVFWKLSGWRRAFACWAVFSLTWAGLMTGIATGVTPGVVQPGGWLLAIVPPLIAGAVVTAYCRINKTYRV